MAGPAAIATERGPARLHFTTRTDGDFNADVVARPVLEARRRAVVDLPWTMLDEVHGTDVVVVTRPGEHDGARADAAVVAVDGAVVGIWVGDCAPVALVGGGGVLGAVHAGWRGAAAGVLGAAVEAMRALGERDVTAVVGPTIGPECYEFGRSELDGLAGRFGPSVLARTAWGTPALDMVALLRAALAEHGVPVVATGPCTGCDDRYWSHRRRQERGRQVMALWREPA